MFGKPGPTHWLRPCGCIVIHRKYLGFKTGSVVKYFLRINSSVLQAAGQESQRRRKGEEGSDGCLQLSWEMCRSDHPLLLMPDHPRWPSIVTYARSSSVTIHYYLCQIILGDHPLLLMPDHPRWPSIITYARSASVTIHCYLCQIILGDHPLILMPDHPR